MKPLHEIAERDYKHVGTQPPTVVCETESQLEYIHIGIMHGFFCTFGADLYAQWVFSNYISASELRRRKFTKGALLVGYWYMDHLTRTMLLYLLSAGLQTCSTDQIRWPMEVQQTLGKKV